MEPVNRFAVYAGCVILASSLSGCGVLGFDHSTRVARGLVYARDGVPDYAAITALLNTRFPSGSNFSDLTTFIQSLDGKCGRTGVCEIPLIGMICAYNGIFVSVDRSPDGSIRHIEASRDSRTC